MLTYEITVSLVNKCKIKFINVTGDYYNMELGVKCIEYVDGYSELPIVNIAHIEYSKARQLASKAFAEAQNTEKKTEEGVK